MSGKVFCPITLILCFGLIFVSIFSGCGKEEGRETEEFTVELTPSTHEIKGEQFSLQLSNLKIIKTIDKSTKELTAIPTLRGDIKISNKSNKILTVQEITIQYLDSSGNPIPFWTGVKNVTVSSDRQDLKPGTDSKKDLTVTVPIAAVKDKLLHKIHIEVVYGTLPLKRNAFDIPVDNTQHLK